MLKKLLRYSAWAVVSAMLGVLLGNRILESSGFLSFHTIDWLRLTMVFVCLNQALVMGAGINAALLMIEDWGLRPEKEGEIRKAFYKKAMRISALVVVATNIAIVTNFQAVSVFCFGSRDLEQVIHDSRLVIDQAVYNFPVTSTATWDIAVVTGQAVVTGAVATTNGIIDAVDQWLPPPP